MNVMIGQMSLDTDPEMGNAVQLSNIIKMLLDPDNMLTAINKSEKIDFLNYFYKHCILGLIGELCNKFSIPLEGLPLEQSIRGIL